MTTNPCPKCGPDALTMKKPVFDGLRKTGERIVCASCGRDLGAVSAEAALSSKKPSPRARPSLFDDVELPEKSNVFAEESEGRWCHRCLHYVVNPFRQWCGRHRRDVEALGTCWDFEAKPEPDEPEEPPT